MARVKEIRVVDINVSVSNAMPSTLKHLEDKPFFVLETKLEAQGYLYIPATGGGGGAAAAATTSSTAGLDMQEVFGMGSNINDDADSLDGVVSSGSSSSSSGGGNSSRNSNGDSTAATTTTTTTTGTGNGSTSDAIAMMIVESDPVPSILIGYRLERAIVADMLKDNAKQVLKDTFSFDAWGRSPNAVK